MGNGVTGVKRARTGTDFGRFSYSGGSAPRGVPASFSGAAPTPAAQVSHLLTPSLIDIIAPSHLSCILLASAVRPAPCGGSMLCTHEKQLQSL